MNWKIIAIGKPKFGYARAGVEEYAPRLQPYTKSECLFVRDEAALLEKSEGSFRLLLDETGKSWSSQSLASQFNSWEQQNIKTISVLIGGADGHSSIVRNQADATWSLSPLTFPHEMALVMVLEQIYRAYTIKAGLPYHRQ